MKIQIFLTTHNRPEYIDGVIDSILKQSFKDFELVISDNSNNELTRNLIDERGYIENERLRYIKRNCIPPIDHFNIILKEVESEYFMIFHDDDIMLPDMVGYLYQLMVSLSDNSIVAVGCNAFLLKGNLKTKKTYMKGAESKKENIISENHCDLALMYFDENNCPFDSYLYKSNVAKKVLLNKGKGGKYCDLSFLLDVNSIGKLLISYKPLMYLRIHKAQDSKSHSLLDRITLLNYIKIKTNASLPEKKFKVFQLYNVYAECSKKILIKNNKISSKRILNVSILLIKYGRLDWLIKLLIRVVVIRIY